MKVLHLISGGDSGGAKTHLFMLLDALKTKIDVRIGCLMAGPFYRELDGRGVDYVLFPQKSRFDLSVVSDIVKMIKDDGFEVLHLHGARANFVGMFVKRRVDIPVITTIHSDYLLDFDDPVKKLIFTNLNVLSLKKIPYFIGVSDTFRRMMIERGFRPNAVYTVYNGMDFSLVPKEVTSRSEFAEKHGFVYDENKIYIGIAARFDKVKGVDVFIRAASEVIKKRDDVIFLIAGDGAERENLMSLKDSLGCGENVKFLGFVRDIYAFYALLDINTLTSHSESFPYSMLEGAAMGRPMVASEVGGIPSLVKDNETGFLFDAGDHEMLAERLLTLCRDRELRLRLGESVKNHALSNFSSEKFAHDHIKIYKSIIKDHKSDKRYDFILSGYYGFGNSGDDALLLSLCENIKKADPDKRLVIMSKDPKRTRCDYGVDAVSRINIFKFLPKIKGSRVLLSGGGSLLQDETSSKSLYYYLSIIKLGKMLGLPVMQIANGFGPVTKKGNRKLTRDVINECVDKITLRDEGSLHLMREIGVTKNITLTADPAMLLDGTDKEMIRRRLCGIGIPSDKEYITVSVREWKKSAQGTEASVAETLRYLYEKYGFYSLLIPMQDPNDIDISRRIAEMAGEGAFALPSSPTIKDTIGMIGGARLNIAMRLHAMIYAVTEGTPTVALRYDPKIEGFMRYAGLYNIIDIETLTRDALISASEDALAAPVDGERRDELKRLAALNIEHAMRL